MGLLVSAESFNPRDGTTITGQDVVMKDRQYTKTTRKSTSTKNICEILKQDRAISDDDDDDDESNSAPRWPRRETHPVCAADLRRGWKKKYEGKFRFVSNNTSGSPGPKSMLPYHCHVKLQLQHRSKGMVI